MTIIKVKTDLLHFKLVRESHTKNVDGSHTETDYPLYYIVACQGGGVSIKPVTRILTRHTLGAPLARYTDMISGKLTSFY